jgi:ribosomal protein L16/L10AE
VANSTITKKPNETRMGKGKAEMSYWISTFKPGQVILSIKDNKSVPVDLAQLTKKIRRTLSFTSSTFIRKSRWIL